MNKIKYLFYLFILALSLGAYKVYLTYELLVVAEIKKMAADKLQLDVDLKSIQISSLYPTAIKLKEVTLKKGNSLSLSAGELEFQILNLVDLIKMKSKQPEVNINLRQFNMSFNSLSSLSTESKNNQASKATSINSLESFLPQNKYISDIALKLTLEGGSLDFKKDSESLIISKIKKTEVNLESLKSDIKIAHEGTIKLKADFLNLEYPLSIKSTLRLDNGWISSSATLVSLMGLDCHSQFKFHLAKKYIDLTNKIDISNLNKLPLNLIEHFPISKLFGSLRTETKVIGYIEQNPFVSGLIDLKIFSADLNLKKGDISSSGTLKLNLNSTFNYANSLKIEAIKWNADFTKLYIEKTNFIKKPSSIKLISEGSGNFKQDFKIDNFNLQFDEFSLNAMGILSKEKLSSFKFHIPAFNLAGIEKHLLFIPQYPLKGSIEAKGEIEGYLSDPKNLSLKLEPFKLKNFKYILYKKINDVEVEGPIQADISGSLSVKNQVAEKGDIKGYIDAMNLDIRKNGESLKINEDPLKIEFKTAVINKTIQIERFDIKSLFGHLDLKGKPPLSLNDNFQFDINLHSMNWNRIRNFLPKQELLNGIKNISGKGSLSIKGVLNPKDLVNSDIKVSSRTSFTINEIRLPWDLKMNSTPVAQDKTQKEVNTIPPPFVNNKKRLNSLVLFNELNIGKVIFKDNQSIEGISVITESKSESIQVKGSIKSFFEGQLSIDSLVIPLTVKDPQISYQVSSLKLNLGKMVSLVLPSSDNLIKGFASFKTAGSSYLPYSVSFKKGLTSTGQFHYENGRIDTFNFAHLIKEKLLTIPAISTPKVLEKNPLEGSISSEFRFKDLNLQLNKFKALTKRNEEIELNGELNTHLDTKMQVTLRLSDLPLKGDFINANKDSHGRIEFPIEIKGNLKQPQWSFVGNTLERMTQKYVDFEKRKVVTVAKKEAAKVNRAIQSEVQKQKKKLESEANNKLDKLFHSGF